MLPHNLYHYIQNIFIIQLVHVLIQMNMIYNHFNRKCIIFHSHVVMNKPMISSVKKKEQK